MELRNSIGIVIPTTGERARLLLQSVASSHKIAGEVVVVVVPEREFAIRDLLKNFSKVLVVKQKTSGLASAINEGMQSFSAGIRYANWLGDDDRIVEKSFPKLAKALHENPLIPFAFGQCDYVSDEGKWLGTSKAGLISLAILRFGPDLVPQPASLFRLSDYIDIGGLNTNLKYCFDMDLWIRLSSKGKGHYVRQVCAHFMWHSDSLTVGSRREAIREAQVVRESHSSSVLERLLIKAFFPLNYLIMSLGGKFVSSRMS